MSSGKGSKAETGLRCIVVETVSNRKKTNRIWLYINFSMGLIFAFVFIFSSHPAALVALWNLLISAFAKDWWLLVAACGIFVGGLLLDEKSRSERGLLRITQVDEKGIMMGRPGLSPKDPVFFIPWKSLTAIESLTEELENDSREFLILRMGKYLAYKLRRDFGFNWIDEQTVLTKARQFAPTAEFKIERTIADFSRQDSRYTNIWLQYLAPSGQRERRGRLQPSDRVNRDRFEIIQIIGAGGQGTAYLAKTLDKEIEDGVDGLQPGVRVAIKEYILPVHSNDALSTRLIDVLDNEAKLLSAINHPNVVTLHDCFVEDHRGYMVLEYIDGPSLRTHIKQSGPASDLLVVWWAMEICSVLTYLQGLTPPIIHRDLTPDNLIWKSDRHVKLFDFTVAHQFEAMRLATVVGKQSYMAPEQVKGCPCPQSDIYSLGATMYFLLTGKDPEPLSVSNPRSVRPEISDALDQIVQKCTQFDLKKRYQSPREIEKDLASLAGPNS